MNGWGSATARGSGRVLIVLLVLVLIALVAAGAAGCRPQLAVRGAGQDPGGSSGGDGTGGSQDPGGSDPPPPPPPATIVCPLCGREVTEEAGLHRPLAVVVDNIGAARPQSGLNDACLVYEMLVEGGITRFVALYLCENAAAVGPVRSLRPYMLDLTMPLGAVTAYVGGSPQARADVDLLAPSSRGIDALTYGSAFWNIEARPAPHNTYTSTTVLRAASQRKGYEPRALTLPTPSAADFAADVRSVSLPSGSQSVARFTLVYPYPSDYRVTYDYDTAAGQWMRYLGGAAHIDAATGRQLRATTVVVQFVSSSTISGDPEGRLSMALTGQGEAKIFTLGRRVDARWTKADRTSPVVYKDTRGNVITLPPGSVWVLIAPAGSRLE